MANRMTPPAEGQEKDVLLVLDKQQGKVSAVKGIDKEGNLQTVPPTHGGEFMQVDKNSDVQQLHFQLLPQVSGHFRAGTVQRQGFRSGAGRKGNRGKPPQPYTGGRQAG